MIIHDMVSQQHIFMMLVDFKTGCKAMSRQLVSKNGAISRLLKEL